MYWRATVAQSVGNYRLIAVVVLFVCFWIPGPFSAAVPSAALSASLGASLPVALVSWLDASRLAAAAPRRESLP
jgi:hypothetical protein